MVVPALQKVKHRLQDLGFFVEADYPYLTNGKRNEVNQVDLAAFVDDQRRDISSIAVVANFFEQSPSAKPVQRVHTYLAPVWHLVITHDQIQWWQYTDINQPVARTNIDTLEADFARYRVLPDEIRQLKGFQTSFIHLLPELSEQARTATKQLVVRRFSAAINEVRARNGLHKLSAVGLDLLTAIILDDKRSEIAHYHEENQAKTPQEALRRATHYFPKSFRDLPDVSDDILDIFWKYLRDGMTYRSMTRDDLSDLLSSLYEGVLISPAKRQIQGSYYTPHALARRVLAHMPIEEIDPEERSVLDGSCGAGNLLRAASERLEALLPADYQLQTRATYLSQRMIGIDADPFAIRVARRALIITHIPYDLDWDMRSGDFLETPFDIKPTIIITNPPFQGQGSRGGKEKAAAFLRRYIEMLPPNGILGTFVPARLLQNPDETDFRRFILDQCHLIETWLLPEGSIPSSGISIAVLILRKKTANTPDYAGKSRVYNVYQPGMVPAFAAGTSTSQAYVTQVDTGYFAYGSIVPRNLASLWDRLQSHCPSLQDGSYESFNGVQGSLHCFSSEQHKGWHQCLSVQEGLDTFNIQWEQQTKQKYVDYDSDCLSRRRQAWHFQVPEKIVIQGERNPNSPWRLVAAVDRERLVIKESFHYILPIETGLSLNVLTAILNSSVANAWYSEHDVSHHITQYLLAQLPIPICSASQQQNIEQMVQHISAMKQKLIDVSVHDTQWQAVRDLVRELDGVIAQAYGLSTAEQRAIDTLLSYGRRPGREWEAVPLHPPEPVRLQPTTDIQHTSGEVLAVDVANSNMTVELPGIARTPLRFPIPPAVPGWALRTGVSFSAQIPVAQAYTVMELTEKRLATAADDVVDIDRVDLFNVVPSRLAYLDDEQLWAYASTKFTD